MKPLLTMMRIVALILIFAGIAAAAPRGPQATSTTSEGSNAAATPKKNSSQSSAVPSDSEIAAAKAAHKVWVNLDSGVYHKGGRWYGKTKNGKFMSEADAKKAGYKAAHRD
jgi:hypothetical protein